MKEISWTFTGDEKSERKEKESQAESAFERMPSFAKSSLQFYAVNTERLDSILISVLVSFSYNKFLILEQGEVSSYTYSQKNPSDRLQYYTSHYAHLLDLLSSHSTSLFLLALAVFWFSQNQSHYHQYLIRVFKISFKFKFVTLQ